MAEKALQKVEDQLNCSICLDTYTDPKLLQCFHVYCKECLVRLVVRDQQGQLSLTCPTCRQATPVPATGVSGLQSAFHINHLLEIVEEHKKEKDTAIAETTEGVTAGVALKQQSPCCTEHADEELKLYCETCSEMICYKCALRGGKHHSHDYEPLGEASEKFKKEMSASLEPMGNQLAKIDRALCELETCSVDISVQQEVIKTNIQDAVQELHKVLETRKTRILNRLEEISQGKLKSLATQKYQIETTQAQLHSCVGFVQESIKTESQSEVLKMKEAIVRQVKELTTEFPPAFLKPCTEPDVIFSVTEDATAVLQEYGSVSAAISVVNPVQCRATGSGLKSAVLGVTSTATVHAVSWKGCACLEPIKSLVCELESMLTGARVRGGVKERGAGQYEISYMPVTKGRNLLLIKVGKKNIKGSPFNVAVTSPVGYIGLPIHVVNNIQRPGGIAFNHAGEMVISQRKAHCVSVFSPSGTKLQSFGVLGSEPGEFQYPIGVAVDDEDNILVADSGNQRIQKFTGEGQCIVTLGVEGICPAGIAFDTSSKKVYVVDRRNHRTQVLISGASLSGFTEKYSIIRAGKTRYPLGVACDFAGNVYIADNVKKCVLVFSAGGQLLGEFGGGGQLESVVDIAVDIWGKVLVSDVKRHCILVFTGEGRFVTWFGQQGSRPGEFQSPGGLAIDDYGVLYVCDYGNNRVQMF